MQGGSIANVIAGVRNRHPYADRPLLDFTLIMMMVRADRFVYRLCQRATD